MSEPFDQDKIKPIEGKFTWSASTAKIDQAFAKAQAKFLAAIHDKKGARNNSYATIGAQLSAARPALGEFEVHVMQWAMESERNVVRIVTRISHAGEFYQSISSMPVSRPEDPQSHGSSYTYLRRYTLAAALGLVDTDDDDDGAGGSNASKDQTKDPIATAPAAAARPVQKAAASGLTPPQQVTKMMNERKLNPDLVGRWLRAHYPNIEYRSMNQTISSQIQDRFAQATDQTLEEQLAKFQKS